MILRGHVEQALKAKHTQYARKRFLQSIYVSNSASTIQQEIHSILDKNADREKENLFLFLSL